MMVNYLVMPAQAGISCICELALETPAFAGVTYYALGIL